MKIMKPINDLLEDKLIPGDIESFRDFSRMDAFAFTYYAMSHREDTLRTERYFDNCSEDYVRRVLMWINIWRNYREN